jgi:formylglycine-generating enzyme required for sulfatase activity
MSADRRLNTTVGPKCGPTLGRDCQGRVAAWFTLLFAFLLLPWASANAQPAISATDEQAVRKTIQSWVEAWTNRDVESYLAHYSGKFVVPGGVPRPVWEAQRKERLARPAQIRIFISEPEIMLTGPRTARATFRQDYRSDLVRLQTIKHLDFLADGSSTEARRWFIVGEWVDDPPPTATPGVDPVQLIPAVLGEIDSPPDAAREVEVIELKAVEYSELPDGTLEMRLKLTADGFDVESSESRSAIVLRFDTPTAPEVVMEQPLLFAAGPVASAEITRRANPLTMRLRLRDPEARFEYVRDKAETPALRLRVKSGVRRVIDSDELCYAGKPAAARRNLGSEEGKRLVAYRPWHVLRDCPTCPELVVVPGGKFTMGSKVESEKLNRNELPAHEVDVGPFAVGKYEVTVAEYRAFTKATFRVPDAGCKMLDFGVGRWERVLGLDWAAPGFIQNDRHPVVCISWDDARDYVDWLSRRTKKSYRLLSEAEWEFIAATGDPRSDEAILDPRNICRYANVADSSQREGMAWKRPFPCEDQHWYTAAAGSFRMNKYGIADLFGNVWEMLDDCWNGSYAGAPADGRAWVCGTCQERVRRGGAWNSPPEIMRIERRSRQSISSRSATVGFRVARELE